jgi:predicted nuclease with TOPRIM domain
MSSSNENTYNIENLSTYELKKRYIDIQKKYTDTLSECNIIRKKYDDLLSEYSENTIITSMNDMKKEYEYIESQLKKLKNLNTKYFDTVKAVKLMIETLIKTLSSNDELEYENSNLTIFIYQLKLKLKFVIEILENINESLYDLF